MRYNIGDKISDRRLTELSRRFWTVLPEVEFSDQLVEGDLGFWVDEYELKATRADGLRLI